MKKIPLIIFLTIVIVFCSIPAFADESSDFTIENGVLTSYDGPGGDVVIPDGVISIDWNAFDNKSNLKSVAFPSSVTSVHPDTFLILKILHIRLLMVFYIQKIRLLWLLATVARQATFLFQRVSK